MADRRLRLGFACHWSQPRESTVRNAVALREALGELTDVVDVGVGLSPIATHTLKVAGVRRTDSGWKSNWRHGLVTKASLERDLRSQVCGLHPEAVLEIQDIGTVPVPAFIVQDLSYAMLIDRYGINSIPHFRHLSSSHLQRLRRRQERVFEGATGLFPMSEWMARSLVEHGISADRVRVVNPGMNVSLPAGHVVPPRRRGPIDRLLMVGRDFDTKGGDQVVKAFRLLRAQLGEKVSLTIAGPKRWPLHSSIPAGIEFLGSQSQLDVSRLMDSHDLFVMPSRFEGFGIAFAEALVRGLPCIGRDDCAMPEIIDDRTGGRLVRTEEPAELAELIVATLADDELYEACAAAAGQRAAWFQWSRAATQVVEGITDLIG